MAQEDSGSCCTPMGCCKVEALVGVDERGQMVLPKELREKMGVRPNDKLAVVSWESNGRTCCLFLVKADEIAGMVRAMLGPMMKELVKE